MEKINSWVVAFELPLRPVSKSALSAGKNLSDPNTLIWPTRKKPGLVIIFLSEFEIWTFGCVRMKNRVGFGFINSGLGCPNFRWNSGPNKFGHSDKCPDPIFLAYKIWATNEFGHSDIRSFGHSVIWVFGHQNWQNNREKTARKMAQIRSFGHSVRVRSWLFVRIAIRVRVRIISFCPNVRIDRTRIDPDSIFCHR